MAYLISPAEPAGGESPILRAPISPAPRPRRMRSSPVLFDPVPSKRVKRAWEDGEEPTTGCAKVRVLQFILSFTHLPFDPSVSPAQADTRSHHTSANTYQGVARGARK